MRLIINGFQQGLVDEDVVTRMGLVRYQAGPAEGDFMVQNCPATDIENFDFSTVSALTKMPGRDALHTSPWQNSAIIRMYQWASPGAVEHSLVFSCVSGATSAAIARFQNINGQFTFTNIAATGAPLTGWNPTINDAIDIVAFAGSAVMTYGDDLPLAVYTGEQFIAPIIGTGTPSGAKLVASWGSYLFAANILVDGVRQRSRIVWSNPLNVYDWPTANYMDLDTEDGDPITAMWLFKDSLVVFKMSKTYLVKYVGGSIIFAWERISNSIGCVGPNAVVEDAGILYFIGQDGFYAYDGVHPPYSISDNIASSVERMNMAVAYTAEVDCYGRADHILFAVSDSVSTYKNRIYIYDKREKSWTVSSKLVSSIGNLVYDSHLMYISFPNSYESYNIRIGDAGGASDAFMAMGSYDGFLYRFGESSNDLGNPIYAYWVSPWIDFSFPDRNKRIIRGSIYLDSTGSSSYTITFTGYSDWDDITPKVVRTITTGSINKDITEKRIDFTLPVRSFKFKLEVNDLNASIVIHKLIFEFMVKGRTLVS